MRALGNCQGPTMSGGRGPEAGHQGLHRPWVPAWGGKGLGGTGRTGDFNWYTGRKALFNWCTGRKTTLPLVY